MNEVWKDLLYTILLVGFCLLMIFLMINIVGYYFTR